MMKQLIALFICITFFAQVKSQDSVATSLLWEISGNGLKETSYLFGTIHIRCGEEYKIPKVVVEKLKHSSSLFGEVDIYDPSYQDKYKENMFWDKKLDSILGDSLFKAASTIFLKTTNESLSNFNQIHPFLTNQFYYYKSLVCNKKAKSVEQELIKVAKKNNIDIDGLETAREHLKVV